MTPLLSPRRILVPLDLSECAQSALAPAREIAEHAGAEVILVSILDHARLAELHPLFRNEAAEDQRRTRQAALEAAARTALPGRAVRCLVVEGDVESGIVKIAAREAVDLIVMGTHEWKGFRRGYVEGIVRHAPCAVLTVKAPREGGAGDAGGHGTR